MELKEIKQRIYRLEDTMLRLIKASSIVENAEGIDDKYDAMKNYIDELGMIEELLNNENSINYYD